MPYPEYGFCYLQLQEIAQPMAVIDDFFVIENTLPKAVTLLHRWLRSAFAQKSRLNRADVLHLLYFQEQVVKLLEAAYVLYKNPAHAPEQFSAIAPAANNLLHPRHFCPPGVTGHEAWDYFPRHLSRAEYLQPLLAIEKCFAHASLPRWRQWLVELFHAATEHRAMATCTEEPDLYLSCRCLFKLIEACHLCWLRAGE